MREGERKLYVVGIWAPIGSTTSALALLETEDLYPASGHGDTGLTDDFWPPTQAGTAHANPP